MASVASGGTADRIAARILFNVLRAGSGTAARYSSTFFGATLPFAAEPRSPEFAFFIRVSPLSDYHAAVRQTQAEACATRQLTNLRAADALKAGIYRPLFQHLERLGG